MTATVLFLGAVAVVLAFLLLKASNQNRELMAATKELLAGCMVKVEARDLVVDGLVATIRDANPTRTFETLPRRMIKLMEEMGEASEAYLNMSNGTNAKKKTWDDLREELMDVVIVAVDMALTRFPHQGDVTDAELESEIMEVLGVKIKKWLSYQPKLLAGDDA